MDESLLHGCSDRFLMSILLFLLTFLVAINLKEFKSSPYFPNKVGRIWDAGLLCTM